MATQEDDNAQGQRNIQQIRTLLGDACTQLEALLEWRDDDRALQGLLGDAYESLDRAQNDLDMAVEYLQKEQA